MVTAKKDILQGTLVLMVFRTLAREPITATESPFIFRLFQRTCCASRKVRCTQGHTAWSRKAASARSGARRKTTAAPATTG